MKKFFSLCLMSMAVATISAQNQNLPFTVSPAEGPVKSINTIVFEIDPNSGYAEFEVISKSGFYMTLNGDHFCDVTVTGNESPVLEIIPQENIYNPGEYALVVEEGSLGWWSADYKLYAENEQLAFTWAIEGDAPVVGGEYPFTVDPEPGSVVESIYTVSFELDPNSGFSEFEVISSDESSIFFTLDGEFFCDAEVLGNETDVITITPTAKLLLQPGEYTLTIEAGSLGWWSADGSQNAENEKIVYTYIIEGGEAPVGGDYPFTVDPAPDSEIQVLDTITLTLSWDGEYSYMEPDTNEMYFTKDGKPIPAGVNAYTYDDFEWYITPNSPITEPGNYALVIPAGAMFYLTWEEYEDLNSEDIIINYIVTGPSEPAGPVVYDVEPTGYNPKDGSEIDFDSRNFDHLYISVAEGIMPAENAYIMVTPVGYEDEAIEAPLTNFVTSMKQIQFEFPVQDYNGEYIVTIPQGSFGDEAWLSDPETGHANAEIELHYFVVNASERESAISYTLMPEVTWNEDLTIFTLVFEEETFLSKYYPFATLAGVNVNYSVYTTNIVDNGNSTFTITFAEAPTEDGTYRFSVERACFGDAEFIESDEEAGVANAEISIEIDITPTAIKAINADNVKAGVYNLYGVKVADSTNNLPAGIYIVNGKKVVVK